MKCLLVFSQQCAGLKIWIDGDYFFRRKVQLWFYLKQMFRKFFIIFHLVSRYFFLYIPLILYSDYITNKFAFDKIYVENIC